MCMKANKVTFQIVEQIIKYMYEANTPVYN